MIKQYGEFRSGDTIVVTNNVAHDLIDGGYAILSKDMTAIDMKQGKINIKHAKRNINGNIT